MSKDEHRPNSPDRKTRVDGDRVIHTPAGKINDTNHNITPPMGLTEEQHPEELYGKDVDRRHVREAARGEREGTFNEAFDEKQPTPGEGRQGDRDQSTEPPYGKGDSRAR